MASIWITTKQAAELEQVSDRTMRRNKKKYIFRPINGAEYEFALCSLSKPAQARYRGEQDKLNEDVLLSLTDAQRELVFTKLSAVEGYQSFKETYPKKDKQRAFLAQYNEQHPDNPITKNQLNHWEVLYFRDGIAGLVDRRGTWNKGVSSIPEVAKQMFLAYWLQEKGTNRGGPSVASCYRLTQQQLPELQLPSVSTFERMVRNLPQPLKILMREGRKAYRDKCEPYIKRNYNLLHTNQCWVADNHEFDVLVRFPDGRVGRPWVVGWMDMASRYIVGFHVVIGDVNANDILEAFTTAVGEYGIPEGVLLDNGADYKVPDLFNRENAYSLANEMRIAVTNALPFNAKAKPIERFFGTLEYSALIFLTSYVGANPKRRPDRLQTVNAKLKDEAIPYEEFLATLEYVIGQYNNMPHSGHGMNGLTPCKAFEEKATVPIRKVSPELLALYCQRRTKLLQVGRNGIKIAEFGQYYDDNQLFPYFGKKVYAKYKPSDVRKVYCFTEEGRFICTATSVELGEMNQEASARQMHELNKKKSARRKMINELVPSLAVPSLSQIAIEEGFSFSKPNLQLLSSVEVIDPKKQRQAETIAREEVMRQNAQMPAEQRKAVVGMLDPDEIDRKLSKFVKTMGG